MDSSRKIKPLVFLDTSSRSSNYSPHFSQASSLSPIRIVPSEHMSQTSTPLRNATPRDIRNPNTTVHIFKNRSPALSSRTQDTPKPPASPFRLRSTYDLHSNSNQSVEVESLNRLLTDKETACTELTRVLEQLKHEISEKNKQIFELRSIVGTYETKLKSYFSKDYEKLLVQKDVQIKQLEDENKRFKDKLEQETQKLARLLADGDRKLSEVRQQIVVLIKKNQELEGQKNTAQLYEILQKFQKENKLLSDKLQTLTSQNISHQQYAELEEQFHAIEGMQDQVLIENASLKKRLEDTSRKEQALIQHLTACNAWLSEARTELSQLIVVVKTVKEGSQINLSLLLTPGGEKKSELNSFEQLTQSINQAKATLSELRILLLEIYSDYCSQACAVH